MMKSPFPGMDPYLESRWSDVHGRLAIYAADALALSLPPGLVARAGERAVVMAEDERNRAIFPDVSVVERHAEMSPPTAGESSVAVAEPICISVEDETWTQRFVEIYDAGSGGQLITVIEFISPTNKRRGDGLEKYLKKQQECRDAGVNFLGIDLTRNGDRSLVMPIQRLRAQHMATYHALLWKPTTPGVRWLYRLPLHQRLPAIKVPLRPTDADVLLDLQPLVDQVYENGRYSQDLDYTRPPDPPLAGADKVWADELLARHTGA